MSNSRPNAHEIAAGSSKARAAKQKSAIAAIEAAWDRWVQSSAERTDPAQLARLRSAFDAGVAAGKTS